MAHQVIMRHMHPSRPEKPQPRRRRWRRPLPGCMGCGHGSWGLPECSGQGADILLFSDDVHAQMECAQCGPSLRPRDCTCLHSLQQEDSQFVLTGRYALLSMQRRRYCAVSRSGLATRGPNSMPLQGMRSNKVSKSTKEQSQSSQGGHVVPMSCSPTTPCSTECHPNAGV